MQSKISGLIKNLRRKEKINTSWPEFYNIVTQDTDKLCEELNTRWLISVCDTIVDYGNDVEAANAMTIVTFTNVLKLWASEKLLYKQEFNFKHHAKLKLQSEELWDGMMAFRPISPHGDMTWNLFKRINRNLAKTPYLKVIFKTIIQRIKDSKNPLSELNKLHGEVFKNAI